MRLRLGVLTAALWLGACAPNPYRTPSSVRDYDILIPGRDTLAVALTTAFQQAGFRVRRQPRGGGPPPAALIYYEFSPPGAAGPGASRWLSGRLYHARFGNLLAAATLSLDSLPPGAPERARRLVEALLAVADATSGDAR